MLEAMLILKIRNILLILLIFAVSGCAVNQTTERSPGVLSEYINHLTGSERNSAKGFIQFLRSQVYRPNQPLAYPET